MAFALALAVKATIVLAIGLIAVRVLHRVRASIRHVILAATFGALVAIPLYDALGIDSGVVVPIAVPKASAFIPIPPASPSSPPVVASARPAPPPASRGASLPLVGIVATIWAAGAALLIASLVTSLWRLHRLTRHALPWLEVRPLARALAAEADLPRAVDVVLHEDVDVPLTWGLMRPVVILPMDAPEWSDASLRHALLHEMEHVYRRDWLGQLIARAVRALYWFHPLVWTAMRRLSLEAERACDDAVIRTADRTTYADQLVSLAKRLKGAPRHAVPAMACRSDLSTRVRALLDERQRRGRARALPHLTAIVGMCLLVSAVGSVRAVEQPPAARLGPELREAPWAPIVKALFGESNDQSSRRSRRPRDFEVALIEAAEEGDLNAVNGYIGGGIDVNTAVVGDGTALIAAARAGQLDVVQLLLDRGADVDLGVAGDGNPLIMAAKEGHQEVVDLLLARGASIDLGVLGDGNALIMAAGGGHLAIVEMLLARGAAIEQVVEGDENALIRASEGGHLAVVQLLVGRGADVNARVWATRSADRLDGEWRTPLNMALRGRHTAVVNFLRSAGARE